MAEMELSENSNGKRNTQSVSVPFLWEEKPGTPKKDWKPSTQKAENPFLPPPVKLVASIPFKWEEMPGKPLPCFSQQPPEPEDLIALESTPRENNDAEQDRVFETDLEACGFGTPSSPVSETDSSRSSYATGVTSLVGTPFLECLFPLLSPNLSFLEKLACTEKSNSYAPRKVGSTDFDQESNCSVSVRRPLTLGELIMMSRRRSYRRKAVQMRRQTLPMESMNKRAVGCCIFAITNAIEGFQGKWKRQLQLKLA